MKGNNNSNKSNQKPIFLMVAALTAIGMLLSVGLVVTPIQQASACSDHNNKGDGNTSSDPKQKQTIKCSGFAVCSNEGSLDSGL